MPRRANNTELDRAWAAGFVDGEGCITLSECTKKKTGCRWFSAIVDVCQVNRKPLDKLQSIIGGRIRVLKDEYGTAYQWRAYGDNTLVALKRVLPYLVGKRRQAELVIEFQKTKRKSWERLAPEVHVRREAIFHELRALNARRKRVGAERLSEAAPRKEGDAIVRTAVNKEAAETDGNVQSVRVN